MINMQGEGKYIVLAVILKGNVFALTTLLAFTLVTPRNASVIKGDQIWQGIEQRNTTNQIWNNLKLKK